MQGGGDERFARAGRRVEDDVLAVEEFEDGLFLRRVERQALAGRTRESARGAGRCPSSRPEAGGRGEGRTWGRIVGQIDAAASARVATVQWQWCATALFAGWPGSPAAPTTVCGRGGSRSSTTPATSTASPACRWTRCGARRSSGGRGGRAAQRGLLSEPRPAPSRTSCGSTAPTIFRGVQEQDPSPASSASRSPPEAGARSTSSGS